MTSKPPERLLSGIRVLDFTTMMAGPSCTRYLADLGADVVKVEPPGGDYMRSRPPFHDGRSAYFGHMNAGKRSIVIDLADPAGLGRARELAARADVIVESFRPGVMRRFGLDHASLRNINPCLVYCSISGFGAVGPQADRAAYAQVVQAATGYERTLSEGTSDGRPLRTTVFVADMLAASYALSAILAALMRAQQTGQGQYCDVTLVEAMMNLMVYEFQSAGIASPSPRLPFRALRASDGFLMVSPTTQKNFESLAKAIGRDDLLNDPRFASTEARNRHYADLLDLIEEWTSTREAADGEAALVAAGAPCARYRSVAEARDDDLFDQLGSFATVTDGALELSVPNLPFRLHGTAIDAHGSVPELDEHRDDIIAELAEGDDRHRPGTRAETEGGGNV